MSEELTPDEVRAALRDYFADRPGLESARRLRDPEPGVDDELARLGFDPAAWQGLVEHLGLASLGAPEELGGLGLSMRHLVAAVEECAASLSPGPVRAAALLSWTLRAVSREPLADLSGAVERFLQGTTVPGVSLSGAADGAPEYGGGAVTGRFRMVTHGSSAELVLGIVRSPQGPALALVRTDPGAVGRSPLPTVDLTTPLADVVVERAAALLLTPPGDADALRLHHTAARALLAAEQVGGAVGCLTGMVSYALVRLQFGQLIGAYQAVQHHCSTTAVNVAAARALVDATAVALDRGDAASGYRLGLLARAEAAECFRTATDTYIQVSGGIGFTWEHDAHLFFRRARATAAVAGTPEQHRHQAVEDGCLELLLHGF